MIKLPPELEQLLADSWLLRHVAPQLTRRVPALHGLVRRQSVGPQRPAAGAGCKEIRRVHGRRGCGAAARRRPISTKASTAGLRRRSSTSCSPNPNSKAAKELLADTYEQLGYQAESGPWRGVYLQAAYELRNGVPSAGGVSTASPDTIKAMAPEMLFDYLAVRLERAKSGRQKDRTEFQVHRSG